MTDVIPSSAREFASGPTSMPRAPRRSASSSARALEGMTAVIVNLNKRYRAHAGVQVTGLD